MTPVTIVPILQAASAAAFVAIAALSIRDWLGTKAVSQMYLALAIGCLAAVSVLGQVGKLLGPGFTAVSSYFTIVIFLASGLALMLFRDSVIPLMPRTRRLVLGAAALTALFLIALQLVYGRNAPKPLQFAALVAFIVVWSGCVGEPSVRLWLNARRRTAVQRARMRALSLGYLAIIAILLAAVFTASLAKQPAVQIGFALASLAIVPLLYAGFAAPAWLRRTWRQGEESKFQQATHDIVIFSTDQTALARRALEWAVRLTGTDSGFFTSGPTILAIHGMSRDEAEQVKALAGSGDRQRTVPLGGRPPRTAIVVGLPASEASLVLVGGPFTPVFGSDEQAWIQQYASLVATGLERVRLAEQVTARTRELESANRELEAFSYTISHDLRAPLRAINGFTSILLDEYAATLPEDARGYLKRVKDNGDHMGNLVDDLLAFSRLGRQTLRTQTVKTRDAVDRALAQLAPEIEGRKMEIVIGELPDCKVDPLLLEQVFTNLLSNAIKYSKKRENARVEVGAQPGRADEGPVFFVRDNGAGFDMAYADKLFGVFQRLHRSQDYEGTGVGLAIVHRIVERHGGRIWAEAKIDQGATFYFTLKGAQEWQVATAA